MSAVTDSQPSLPRDSWRRALPWLLGVALAVQVAPVWLTTWLPMGDLGGHLELMDIVARYHDPRTVYATTYLLPHGLNPNTVALYLAQLLPWVGTLALAKVLISLYLIGVPLSLWLLARAFDRSPWLVLLSLPLCWNALFNVGFLNYLVALPLLLAVIAWSRQAGERGGAWRLVGLGASLVLLFFCHMIAFLIGLGMAAAVLLAYLPSWRNLGRLLALLPACWPLLSWIKRKFVDLEATEAGRTFGGGNLGLVRLPFKQLLAQIPEWGMQFFRDKSDDIAFGLLVALWLVALAWGVWQLRHRPRLHGAIAWLRAQGLEILTLCCIAAYFIVPSHMNEMANITERIVVQVLLLLVLWPRITFSGTARWLIVPMTLLALLFPVVVHAHFQQFEREELGHLPQALQRLPDRSRLGYLLWQRENRVTFMGPLWHLPRAIFVLAHGGVTDDSFAARPYTPVQFRAGQTPEKLDDNFWSNPHVFDYDHVLIRSRSKPTLLLTQPMLRLIFAQGEWWLFAVQTAGHRGADVLMQGGSGGVAAYWDCPKGEVLGGLTVRSGAFVRGIQAHCFKAGAGQRGATGPRLGDWSGQERETPLLCPPGQQIVGFHGHSASLVDQLGVQCATPTGELGLRREAAGGSGGSAFQRMCPPGSVAIGVQGRFGVLADAIGLDCARAEPAPQNAQRPSRPNAKTSP